MITTITYAVLLAIIIGLIQCLKGFGMDSKWSPVVAIFLGLILQVGTVLYGETELFLGIINGLALGLAAVGLFSGTRSVAELVSGARGNAAPEAKQPVQ